MDVGSNPVAYIDVGREGQGRLVFGDVVADSGIWQLILTLRGVLNMYIGSPG